MNKFIGKIFEYKNSYWKIIEVHERQQFGKMERSYYVIKCNKNGKTFKERTSFHSSFIEKLEEDKLWTAVSNEKVVDGTAAGIRKRRIKYLEDMIASFTKELNSLKNETN